VRSNNTVPCPRCEIEIRLDEQHKGACAQCHGVWSPRYSAERVHPILGWIDNSRDEAMRSPQHGTGVGRCPDCDKPMRALSFFAIPIDWCAQCGGVWLDGGELDALREAAKSIEAQPDRGAPFRVMAPVLERKPSLGTVVCTKCEKEVWVDMTYLTGDGVVCVPCGRVLNNEMPSAKTSAEVERWLKGEHHKQPSWIELLFDSIFHRVK
jgi:Zn-finger nucleic acid-binding protein